MAEEPRRVGDTEGPQGSAATLRPTLETAGGWERDGQPAATPADMSTPAGPAHTNPAPQDTCLFTATNQKGAHGLAALEAHLQKRTARRTGQETQQRKGQHQPGRGAQEPRIFTKLQSLGPVSMETRIRHHGVEAQSPGAQRT